MTERPKNKLVLFTAGFPFGISEPFLKNELEHLVNYFDTVILISVNPDGKNNYRLHEKCQLVSFYHKETFIRKVSALVHVFDFLFWKELQLIKGVYKKKINLSILATMLMGLYRAKEIKKCVLQNVKTISTENIFLYSYWCDDTALGIAILQKSYPHLKTFSRIHGWDVYFEANAINYLPYRHFITKHLKAIFSISEKGKQYCDKGWQIKNSEKIKVSRLGVVSQKYLTRSEEKIIATCSNLIPLKRVHLLVEALSQIKNINLKWVHFGDGPELERIQEMSKNALPPNIQWELKGWIENAEIMQWYERYAPSLFINLSTSEGVPVSIMEAMSFGIPAIATHVGGNCEIVTHLNGFLISPNPSVEEIVTTLETYFALSTELREKMHKAAYETWKRDYNSEINYENFCKEIFKL